jgi:hypothetical protein
VGVQPRVDTYGLRKTAHIFGAISLDEAKFTYRFAPVFNSRTFFEFLRQLVARYRGRKVFLIIDNAPCHRLDDEGKRWLRANRHLIELHRLPSYSPESAGYKADPDFPVVPALSATHRWSCCQIPMIKSLCENV